MIKGIVVSAGVALVMFFFISCNNSKSPDVGDISEDTAIIAKGESAFIQNCSSCHNFKKDGIGPQLGGITTTVSADWIKHFIRDPKIIIEKGDKRAGQLVKRFKTTMPSFSNFTEEELNGIVAFLHTHQQSAKKLETQNAIGITNPIPEKIELSNLAVNLELVTQIPASSVKENMPLTRITKLDFVPHSDNTFIVDIRGKLYKLKNNLPVVYMDMAKLKPNFINQPGLGTGFGSFAFHPGFLKNGLLYTTHTESPGSGKAEFDYSDSIKVTLQWVLTEWKTNNPGSDTFVGTGRELFRVNMVTVMHGIQEIAFNPHSTPGEIDYGMLYICIGDGACVEHGFPFLAHNLEKMYGTILRIDPAGKNSINGRYGIPKDNPFVNIKNNQVLKEIYAYGFRNPHRITWGKSGEVLVSNIGQGNIESVNLIMAGHDYGWPLREGTFGLDPLGDLNTVFPLPANDSIHKFTYPVAQYDHDEGIAISGGFEYEGSAIPELNGKFLFGDIPNGRLFFINMSDIKKGKPASIKEWKILANGQPVTLLQLCGSKRVDLHFGKDSHGELYILTKADGKVYKLISSDRASHKRS